MNLYIVTGTSNGLGAALRKHLSHNANNMLVCLSRSPSSTVAPINVQVDLADVASIAQACTTAAQAIAGKSFERAVLIGNAGVIDPIGAFDSIEPDVVAENLRVNLLAPMVLMRWFAAATSGIASQRSVVNISSGAAKRAIAGWSAYCAAKAGLEMATRVAALEAPADLAICSLAPGVIDTPMQAKVRGAAASDFPDVDKFRAMKADGVLRDANVVAREIIQLIEGNKLTNGGNFDIRELNA